MKKNFLLVALTLFSCGVILFGSSSFRLAFEESGSCSGASCPQTINPNTLEMEYWSTDYMEVYPYTVTCCGNETGANFQGRLFKRDPPPEEE